MKSLRILKEFDEKSQNHEISKYCKKYWHAKIDIGENAHYPWKTRFFLHFLLHKSKLKFMLERKVSIVLNEKYL